MVERIINGNFTNGLTGWVATAGVIVLTTTPPAGATHYCNLYGGPGAIAEISQNVDFTDVEKLTCTLRFSPYGAIYVYAGTTLLYTTVNHINWTAFTFDVSKITGVKNLLFRLSVDPESPDTGTFDITFVSAIVPDPPPPPPPPVPTSAVSNPVIGQSLKYVLKTPLKREPLNIRWICQHDWKEPRQDFSSRKRR